MAEVFSELKKVVSMTRKGKGPFLLETFTYRYSGHVGPLSDDFQGYRTKKEINFWKKNDPIKIFQEALYKKKYLNTRKDSLIKKEIYREIKDSFKFAKNSKFPKPGSWLALNISTKSSSADKILKNIKQKDSMKNKK